MEATTHGKVGEDDTRPDVSEMDDSGTRGEGEHGRREVVEGQTRLGGSHEAEILGSVFGGPKHTHKMGCEYTWQSVRPRLRKPQAQNLGLRPALLFRPVPGLSLKKPDGPWVRPLS